MATRRSSVVRRRSEITRGCGPHLCLLDRRRRGEGARRAAMLAAAVAAACLPAMAAAAATPPPRLSTSGTRTRLSFQTGLNHVSDIDFRLLFRVTRDDFQTLHAAVARRLAVEEGMAVLSSGACIPTECRLAFCLRMLASASYLDCILSFGLGRCTVYSVFHQVCTAHLGARH